MNTEAIAITLCALLFFMVGIVVASQIENAFTDANRVLIEMPK